MSSKLEKVVAYMIELRDSRSALKKQFEEQDRLLREKFEKGEAFLLEYLNNAGVDSFKVDSVGTVYTSQRLTASVADRNAFGDYVAQSGEVDLLDYRVNTTALKEYMAANGGQTPPGVTAHTVRNLNIRRS